ncbi:MAG: hypothetical protein HOP30_22075 [Cyclobacteriaceae bacterium]|nr:hypothetical protein [Cyclobacteriaceae bacterium]
MGQLALHITMTSRNILTIIILLLLTACSDNKVISVQVSPEKLILENKEIDKVDFEKELKVIVDARKKEGIEAKELTMDIKADKRTKRGDIADIVFSLKRLNIIRTTYSAY